MRFMLQEMFSSGIILTPRLENNLSNILKSYLRPLKVLHSASMTIVNFFHLIRKCRFMIYTHFIDQFKIAKGMLENRYQFQK